MAKKPKAIGGKKGKKGAGDKDGEDLQRGEKVTEVDKEWFQIQIRSLEDKLELRNERVKQLEQSNREYQERYNQLQEDKADVVAYLKRTLIHRTDEISELQARLEGLRQVHEANRVTYENTLKDTEQEFIRTKEQLGSENMVLTKKLDALEEFRIQREQLTAKFGEQEAEAESRKKEYERILYEKEKQHLKEEDRLKKDMMTKLESVAAEFRRAARAQMSATTQRTIRENVNLTAQVLQLSENASELTLENDKLMQRNRDKDRQLQLLESEQELLFKENAYRLKVIREMVGKCRRQEEQLKGMDIYNLERQQKDKKMADLKSEIIALNSKLGTTNVTTREREAAIADMQKKLQGVSKTRDIINVCLSEAAISIKTALALEVAQCESGQVLNSKEQREDVLNQLLVLLNTAVEESKQLKCEVESSMDVEALIEQELAAKGRKASGKDSHGQHVGELFEYLHGSLGLVPMSEE